MPKGRCPHIDAAKQARGSMKCQVLQRTVPVKNGKCVCDSCSCKR